MSGIPVYTQAPITPQKPTGITPQTVIPPTASTPTQNAPVYAPATTTATPSTTSTYQQAQPGAAPMPAPTGTPSNRYVPIDATPTSTIKFTGPPPPQPGAVPSPHNTAPHTRQASISNLPPPPKAGEDYIPPPTTTDQAVQYPPQMNIPPPVIGYGGVPPASTTSTTNRPTSSYPIGLSSQAPHTRKQSIEHPSGYVQNTDAQTMPASTRQISEIQAQSESSYSYGAIGSNFSSGSGNNNGMTKAAFGVDPEAVWDGIKGWAGVVGKKMAETEEEVWKRIGGSGK